MSSLSSSPCTLVAPHSGFSRLILWIKSRTSWAMRERAAAVEPDEQSSVDPTQTQPTARRALLEDIQLMAQDEDLRFQLMPRLEAVAQHAEKQDTNCDHSAIMF